MTGISASTRRVDASAANEWGTSQSITLEGVRTDAGLSSSWDPLGDGTAFTVTARNSDGYNDVAAQAGIATATVATPGRSATPTCSYASTDTNAPGGYVINPVTRGVYSTGSDRSISGLGAGTYYGWAYTDGYAPNNKKGLDSFSDNCPGMTVVVPYSSTWGLAEGCPAVGIYVTPSSYANFQVRRTGTDSCQARRIISQAGQDGGAGIAGTVLELAGWTFSGGGGNWSPTGWPAGSPQ